MATKAPGPAAGLHVTVPLTKEDAFANEHGIGFVEPGIADLETIKRALEHTLKTVPLLGGVVARDGDQRLVVQLDHPHGSPEFTLKSTDELADRALAKILDGGDADNDGFTMRIAQWLCEDLTGRWKAFEEICGPVHSSGMDALVGAPTIRVQVLQARTCHVVRFNTSHLVVDGFSFLQIGVVWTRAYKVLKNNAPSLDVPLWWDRARFWSTVPSTCPGRTEASLAFQAALPSMLQELAATTPSGDTACLIATIPKPAMRALSQSFGPGYKTFDTAMALFSPEDTRWFGFAYDARMKRLSADSADYLGNAALAIYGRVAGGGGTVLSSDVRRSLADDAPTTSFPTREDVVHGAFHGCTFLNLKPPGFPANSRFPSFVSDMGAEWFTLSSLLRTLNNTNNLLSTTRRGVLSSTATCGNKYHCYVVGSAACVSGIEARLASRVASLGAHAKDVHFCSSYRCAELRGPFSSALRARL